MCSIVGYIGTKQCRDIIAEGLAHLAYRGYDSSGFSCLDNRGSLSYVKAVGTLDKLLDNSSFNSINGHVGIGHTRWATHGVVNECNAHPQFDCKVSLSVVHNGVIENHSDLEKQLKKDGHVFVSETDTESIAHLFEGIDSQKGDLISHIVQRVQKLRGAFATILMFEKRHDFLLAIRKGSPLCIGFGEQEMFIASDPLAFAERTKRVLFLPDESFALIEKHGCTLYNFAGVLLAQDIQEIDVSWTASKKDGHEHYMLKEIYEQKNAIERSVRFYQSISKQIFDYLGITLEQVQELEQIIFLGCGTSWHAGRIAEFFFEDMCGIPTTSILASEFRYRPVLCSEKSICIAISQSGETADTLEAVRLAKKHGIPTIALTNVASSTLVRECDGLLLTQAGPEIAVASTKAFSTQIAALYWLAYRFAYAMKKIKKHDLARAEEELLSAAYTLENVLEIYKHDIVHTHAETYSKFDRFIFLGRHVSYPFALEAALKLKEISYAFTQAYPAGELKHGPLALVDDHTPVFIFSHADDLIYQKIVTNAQEVKARGAHIVSFICEGQQELQNLSRLSFVFPKGNPALLPLMMTGLVQFFAYCIAKSKGCNIDQPRNLAKSVTVE